MRDHRRERFEESLCSSRSLSERTVETR